MIEKICSEEVQAFLDRKALIVDEKVNRKAVGNGYSRARTVQASSGNIVVKLPRVDDRQSTEKFVSRILPPFVRNTPTQETLIAALYPAGVSTDKFQEALRQAEKGWRRLRGFEKLEPVAGDIKFENGVLKEAS